LEGEDDRERDDQQPDELCPHQASFVRTPAPE